jgi:hypothetical protein
VLFGIEQEKGNEKHSSHEESIDPLRSRFPEPKFSTAPEDAEAHPYEDGAHRRESHRDKAKPGRRARAQKIGPLLKLIAMLKPTRFHFGFIS